MAIVGKLGMSKLTQTPAVIGRSIGKAVSRVMNMPAEAARFGYSWQ